MPARAAGRSAATASNSDAASTPATGVDRAALIAEITSQAAGAVPATLASSPGADPGVFALTMNQTPPSGMAATRAEMLAELTQASIEVPLDHADFAEAFARQSANLIVQGSNNAEIYLNPRDMGPIRIAISMDADAASLDIGAAHADTRAAIEASLPALRQMLGDQGLRLASWRLDGEAGGDAVQQSEPQASGQRSPDAQQQQGADAGARDGLADSPTRPQPGPGGMRRHQKARRAAGSTSTPEAARAEIAGMPAAAPAIAPSGQPRESLLKSGGPDTCEIIDGC
jgi:flagellar hook-length control protein FliK